MVRFSACLAVVGRHGLALTLVTQYDIDRIHAIEARISECLETGSGHVQS